MIKKRWITSVLLAGSLAAAGVNAANISYSTAVSLEGSEYFTLEAPGSLNVPDSMSLTGISQFNPADGTLTAVTLAINGNFQSDMEAGGLVAINSMEPIAVSFDASAGIGASVPIGGGSYDLTPYDLMSGSASASCKASGNTIAGCSASASVGGSIDIASTFNGSDMSAFIGTGDLGAFSIDLLIGLDLFTSSNAELAWVDISSIFDGSVSVGYEYSVTPVPIPAAVWLFGSALFGLGVIGRRKKGRVSS